MKNYYQTLGLSINCSSEDVKRAYRKHAKEWHPDKNKSANAQQMFIEIHKAYEILSNPEKRALLDEFLKSQNSKDAIVIKDIDKKQQEFNDFEQQADIRARDASKMNFDTFTEMFFIGLGNAKIIFLGIMGLILTIVAFKVIIDGHPGDGIMGLLFSIPFLRIPYKYYFKNS
jgi:DnaJ-class molecular chaperone